MSKVFIVTYNGYEQACGAEIYLYGVFDSMDKIPEAVKSDISYDIAAINVNQSDIQTYLGGYFE